MSEVLFFDQVTPGNSIGALVGGKGANLIVLTAAGFAVPPGFVVTSDSYRQFLDAANWMEASIAQSDYARPDQLRDRCAEIRRRLVQMPLPGPVALAIREAVARMESGGDGPGALAVRSSSTFEDLAQAAFAGQHDTYLNVRGADAVLDRVRACFASLWEDRAVLYRHHQGFSQTMARMAVVVQQQIQCDVAGVAFSIDPVGGRMDRLLIDANYGLGESVVSGDGEVDHFEICATTMEITTRSIGHKEHKIISAADAVHRQPVPAELADRPCLSDQQIGAIATLLLRVQTHYSWPQDIEWGLTTAGIHLLQSRPVTTIQPDWTRDESAERFPNPMTPLSWDFISVAFSSSLKHSLDLMGFPPLKGDWFRMFDHYIYGDQNAVRVVGMFRPLRARNAEELVKEVPELRRRFAWVSELPINWARDLDTYLVRLGRLEARADPATLGDAARFISDVLGVAQEYFLPNIAISMTQAALHRLLHGLIAMLSGPQQALTILDGLLAGCESKTAMVNREIHEMATQATRCEPLRNELLAGGGRGFLESGRLSAYPDFAARFGRFLADHGHREVDMDYSIPTWSGQPWVVLESLVLLMRSPEIDDPAETMRAQRMRYMQVEQGFLRGVPPELGFFFRELIRLTRTYTMLDDLEHYQTTRINPLAYRAAIGVGKFLREMGVLDEPRDVFFLNKADVESIVAGPSADVIDRCRRTARTNKSAYLAAKERTPDWSPGQPVARVARGRVLRGIAGSPGRASGACFRIRGPEDFGRFPAKAVLVARTTNPAWTPLFYTAAAIITESGGPLSHGAVTAREMGLPAVMSVRDIMNLIDDGQFVRVDGTSGLVELDEVA